MSKVYAFKDGLRLAQAKSDGASPALAAIARQKTDNTSSPPLRAMGDSRRTCTRRILSLYPLQARVFGGGWGIGDRLLQRAFPVVIASLAFAVIAPALWSGWLGDDAYYSVLDGILGADRTPLWQAMKHAFDLWFFGSGRFYPLLIVEKYLVFCVFTKLLAYKLLLVAATVATLEMFRRCVAQYLSRGVANLAAIIAAALFAFRGYQDPILSYNAMPQFVAMLILGSLMAFRHALRDEGRAWSVVSVLLYACAALTYEDAYGFSLLYVILTGCRRRSARGVLSLCWPYLATAASLMLLSVAARSAASIPSYSPYGLNLAPLALVRTLAEQIVAAFPLTYYLFDPSHIFGRSNFYDFHNNAPVQPLVFVAFAAASAYALADATADVIEPRLPIIAGTAVVVLSAAPIAALLKYQNELRPGLGYLPVLYEELGLALVLATLATVSMRRIGRRFWQLGWTIGIAVVATMTQATNVRVVREDETRMEARGALERQLDGGLLAAAPEDSYVTIAPMQDWIAYDGHGPEGISTRGLFFLHGGKRLRLVEPNDRRAGLILTYDAAEKRWRLGHRL